MLRSTMTVLLPLCCAALLTACSTPKAAQPEGLSHVRDWPAKPMGDYTQKDVAKYLVRGKSAYESCKASVVKKEK